VQPSRAPEQTPVTGRLQSLDTYRGGTIAAMILVNNEGSDAAYAPLKHAEWHGWTFTDLIFPSFLWIVGVAITLSFARRIERGDSRRELLKHVAIRSAAIFVIGLALNGFPYYSLATIRIPGVLQRIAICYFVAATIFLFTKTRGRALWTAGLLASYWVLMTMVPVPGYGAGDLSVEGNFARHVDSLFLSGHMWGETKTWDPEGVVSTLPAIANTLFGIFAGQILRLNQRSAEEKTVWLFFAGNCLIVAGLVLSSWMPINKPIWTVPYALFTSGISFVALACSYWVTDVKGWRRYARPLAIYGVNALAVYVLAGLFARLLYVIRIGEVRLRDLLWTNVFEPLASPANASLLYSLAHVALFYAVAYWLYRRNWILRV
jgi:predicted acyltransferase